MLPLSRVLFDAMWFQVCSSEDREEWDALGIDFHGQYYKHIRREDNLLSTLVKQHVRQKTDSLFT